jgi:protein tyrosine phosphatase (PTP) superfamily phosphohydrolase (DUF442 family)
MTDPEDISHWLRLDARLTTSGQPSEAQLPALKALGVETIINLALHSHERALPDEAASAAALGMAYIHIPVPFDAPDNGHFNAFCAAMAAISGQTVHVHCIVNMRVSAFLYRYRRDVLGMDEVLARAAMEQVWSPEGVWAGFVAER